MAPTVESNPLTSLGFRLVTKVSLISNFRSSRDLHLFSIAVGASQSAAYDRKACSTSGAFLFGEWYATRSTDTSFSNQTHLNYRKNPGNISGTGPSSAAQITLPLARHPFTNLLVYEFALTKMGLLLVLIERFVVRNFKSLADVSIAFEPGLNLIIGQNDSGKTNVLRAMANLLDRPSETAFDFGVGAHDPSEDFHVDEHGHHADHYVIAAQLHGGNRPARAPQNFPVDAFQIPESLFGLQSEHVCAKTVGSAKAMGIEDLARAASCAWIMKFAVRDPYRASTCIDIQLLNGDCYHLHDINIGSQGSIIQCFVHPCDVPNHRDEQFLLRLVSTLLLTRYPTEAGKAEQSEQGRRAAAELACTQISELLTGAGLQLGLPEHKLGIQILDFDFSKPHSFFDDKQLKLALGPNMAASSRGDGVISAAVCESLNVWRPAYSLILFDEPENYLHPHHQRLLVDSLMHQCSSNEIVLEWSHPSSKCGQVIIATHSPTLLRLASPTSIKRTFQQKLGAPTAIADLNEGIHVIDPERWRQLIWTKNTEMLFASHVVIVEGGEEYILPALADVYFGQINWFDRHNVSIVRAGGKGAFKQYAAILNAFNISFSVVTDLDFLEDMDSSFASLLTPALKNSRAQMMQRFHALRAAAPTGPAVKAATNNRVADWINLRTTLDNVITNLQGGQAVPGAVVTTLAAQWQTLKNRVEAASHLQDFLTDQTISQICNDLVSALQPHGIFVLSRGDLETYLNPSNLAGSDLSKDRVPLAIAQAIAKTPTWEAATQHLQHANDWEELLQRIKSRL